MKNLVVTLVLIVFCRLSSYGQNSESGIYISQEDFENQKLSYTTNNSAEIIKIRFNEFLDKPYLSIKHNGEKTILFKDEIFAYQKKGRIVRTHNFVTYTFLEKGPIWIYFKDINNSQGKGFKRERKYYFSVSGNGKIIPLTISNLKRSFPNKHLFHHFLDAKFRSDDDLSLYDGVQNKLKINYLLETVVSTTETSTP
jgi:hypothetical protein